MWTKCRTITCISVTLVEIRAGLRLINLETRAPKKTLWAFQTSLLFLDFLSICLSNVLPCTQHPQVGCEASFASLRSLQDAVQALPPSSEGLLCIQIAHWLPSSPTRCELLGAPRLPHYDPAPGTSKVAHVCRVN